MTDALPPMDDAAPAPAAPIEKAAAPISEIGSSGLIQFSGLVSEEYLPQLKGVRGYRAYRDMADGDPTIGAALTAIELLVRGCAWTCEPNPDAPDPAMAQDEADFAMSLWDDMSMTWEDMLGEVLTFLVFGWCYMETVLKRRVGPLERDPTRRSKFNDGRIGIRKVAPRPQDSLARWEFDEDGGISGMWQRLTIGAWPDVFIPIERSILFRTTTRKNNPEGRSVLRNAYRPHWFYRRIQEIEAVGIERDLAGVPVVRAPNEVLNATVDPILVAAKNQAIKIARDIKLNQQGGVVLPSNTYRDAAGMPTAIKQWDLELVRSAGGKAVDTKAVKTDYQRDMARQFLADFLMLGTDKGAYNLGESKQSLFGKAIETYLWQIAAPINRFVLPRIWDFNGLDRAYLPMMKPGRVAPLALDALGRFLQSLAAAGEAPFPDPALSDWVRDEAGMPRKSDEGMALQEQEAAQAAEAAAALAAAQQQAQQSGEGEGGGGGSKPAGESDPKPEDKPEAA